MGRHSKYTEKELKDAVEKEASFAGVMRQLGLKPGGGTQAIIIRKVKDLEISYSHFTGQGHTKGKPALNRKTAHEILVILPDHRNRSKAEHLRRALDERGVERICNRCGQDEIWNGVFLQLEINHIDGNWRNCLFENLEYICPNCHSQQPHSSHSLGNSE